ncbi:MULTISPECIES: hypothetical protein [Serratia]|uniref:hypothetical protein n=1 Tax=Serratia TaxID=613 RepID=UPI00069EE7FB|nr:hypothetical protein [Serratia sp. 506_PEND]
MTTHTVHVMKQARPGDDELAQLWKLYHAAERVEDRWCRNTVGPIAEELANTELSREEKMFLLCAWQVLVDGHGGYARLMGAFDCYVYNVQDPAADHVAYKPELAKVLNDGNLFDVILEAYAEAKEIIEALKSGMEAMATIYEAQKVRIGELEAAEAKLTTPVRLPQLCGDGDNDTEYTEGLNDGITQSAIYLRRQGFKVEGDE